MNKVFSIQYLLTICLILSPCLVEPAFGVPEQDLLKPDRAVSVKAEVRREDPIGGTATLQIGNRFVETLNEWISLLAERITPVVADDNACRDQDTEGCYDCLKRRFQRHKLMSLVVSLVQFFNVLWMAFLYLKQDKRYHKEWVNRIPKIS